MTNVSSGKKAEARAAMYLRESGFKIIDQNWRTRLCEIDIIAQKNSRIYFVEVKYRLNSLQGAGFEYVTAKKLKQMRFASELWLQDKQWVGECSLGALEVSGPAFDVTGFLTDLQ